MSNYKDVVEPRREIAISLLSLSSALERASKHDERTRKRLRAVFAELLLADLEYADEKDVEGRLWRRGCNAKKDDLRKKIKSCALEGRLEEAETHVLALRHLLEDTKTIYRGLIAMLQKVYGQVGASEGDEKAFIVDKKLKEKHFASEEILRRTCSTCLLRLGDLERYGIEIDAGKTDGKDWSVSERLYRIATHVWPKAGFPHNQMAVLAVYEGEGLTACYRYLRALSVHELFYTSKENLTNFFRKADEGGTESRPDVRGQSVSLTSRIDKSFLRVLGILYNQTHLDEADELLTSLRKDLLRITKRRHLKHMQQLERFVHGSSKMLEMLMCCISLVYWLRMVGIPDDPDETRHERQKLASLTTALCLVLGCCIVESCIYKLPEDTDILACLMILAEWMNECSDLSLYPETIIDGCSMSTEFFEKFVKFLNACQIQDTFGREKVALPEDKELRGFIPLENVHIRLDFSTPWPEGRTLGSVRRHRIMEAARKMAARERFSPIRYDGAQFSVQDDWEINPGKGMGAVTDVAPAYCQHKCQMQEVDALPSCEDQGAENDTSGGQDLGIVPHEAESAGTHWNALPRVDAIPPVPSLFTSKRKLDECYDTKVLQKRERPPPGWLDSFQLAVLSARTHHFEVLPDWSIPLPLEDLIRHNPYAWRLAKEEKKTVDGYMHNIEAKGH